MRTMSSAKNKIETFTVPIVTPLFNLRTTSRKSLINRVNNIGERIQPCLSPTSIINHAVRRSPNNTLDSTLLEIFF